MERGVGLVDGIVGAEQDEECHEDEDGRQDHQPVALVSLQYQQGWSDRAKHASSYFYFYSNIFRGEPVALSTWQDCLTAVLAALKDERV